MKKNLLLLLLIFKIENVSCQYLSSGTCEINVNDDSHVDVSYRRPVIDATVLWIQQSGSGCTATLLNRNTDGNDFYLLTAHHCITDGTPVDFTQDQDIILHYESPDASSADVPVLNQGIHISQSTDNPLDPVSGGFEYFHSTKLTDVYDNVWGDFALLHIETPLPVQFDYHFAGWNPSIFFTGLSAGPGITGGNYVVVEHPELDIKKIAGVNGIVDLSLPTTTDCYAITTLIDVVFGWLWGNRSSTTVICNTIDIPWYTVPLYTYGTTEQGSSGSSLFASDNRIIGQLSGGLASCAGGIADVYGKFAGNYSKSAVRNILNPSNDLWTDLAGIGDRSEPSCWSNLTLSADFFPKQDYNHPNEYTITSQDFIATSGYTHIYPQADYLWQAGNAITLNPGFSTDAAGCVFEAKIHGCDESITLPKNSIKQALLNKLMTTVIPKTETASLNNLAAGPLFKIYPNPTSEILQLQYKPAVSDRLLLTASDAYGNVVFSKYINTISNNIIEDRIDVSKWAQGIYNISLSGSTTCGINKKIVVQR